MNIPMGTSGQLLQPYGGMIKWTTTLSEFEIAWSNKASAAIRMTARFNKVPHKEVTYNHILKYASMDIIKGNRF